MKAKKKKREPWRRAAIVKILEGNYLYGEIDDVIADQIMALFRRRRK